MISLLKSLSEQLHLLGYKIASAEVKHIQANVSPGELPDFDWLLSGRFKSIPPNALNDFIEANSALLSQFDVKKFLGSGEIGDAWLLEDGRVLKIFDEGGVVDKRTDYQKFDQILTQLYSGKAPPGIPMIYELKRFEIPDSFHAFRSPTTHHFNKSRVFKPAYAILEYVESYSGVINKYLKENRDRMFEHFNQPLDEDGNIIGEDRSFEPIENPESVPYDLKNQHQKIYDEDELEEFLQSYLEEVMGNITGAIRNWYNSYEEEWKAEQIALKEAEEEGEEDDFETECGYDLKIPYERELLANHFARQLEEDYADNVPSLALDTLQEMLGLDKGWLRRLSHTIVENYYIGRKDLHPGNFGFRTVRHDKDSKRPYRDIVYYDG